MQRIARNVEMNKPNKYSRSSPQHWVRTIQESIDAAKGVDAVAKRRIVENYAILVDATREKRRLTIDWQKSKRSEKEIQLLTASRVGLAMPRLDPALDEEEETRRRRTNNTKP